MLRRTPGRKEGATGVVGSAGRGQVQASGRSPRGADTGGPENLRAAIVWLKSLLAKTFSMNEEGFRRLKAQFDQMYEAHLEKFDSEIAGFAGDDAQRAERFLAAKDILGHLLAVRKYIERIVSTKRKAAGAGRADREPLRSLSQSLHTQLVKELREFCTQLAGTPPIGLDASP